MEAMIAATDWQPYSLRAVMSGALGKKPGLAVTSVKVNGKSRVYRISREAN